MSCPGSVQALLPQGHPKTHLDLQEGVGLLHQQHWQDQLDFHDPSRE